MQVEVERLQGEGRGIEEKGFELGNEDTVFLIGYEHVQFEHQCKLTFSIERIPLPSAWLAIPYSAVLLDMVSNLHDLARDLLTVIPHTPQRK